MQYLPNYFKLTASQVASQSPWLYDVANGLRSSHCEVGMHGWEMRLAQLRHHHFARQQTSDWPRHQREWGPGSHYRHNRRTVDFESPL